jgi:hypothetical protein
MSKRSRDAESTPDSEEVSPQRICSRGCDAEKLSPPNIDKGQSARNATVGYLVGFYQTKAQAATANGVPYQNMAHWMKQYEKFSSEELQMIADSADLPTLLPAAPADTPPASRKSKRGDDDHADLFKRAYKWAGSQKNGCSSLKSGGGTSDWKIAQEARKLFGLETFHKDNVTKAAQTPDTSPPKRGPEPKFPRAFSKRLVAVIQEARARKMPTFPQMVITWAQNMMKNTSVYLGLVPQKGKKADRLEQMKAAIQDRLI